jgi:hypothetical protein
LQKEKSHRSASSLVTSGAFYNQCPPLCGLSFGLNKMPHRLTLSGWLAMLLTHPPDAIRIVIILILGEAGRWLLGGGKLREMLGDLIICLLIFCLIQPHILHFPPFFGVQVSSGQVAIVISLLGSRLIGSVFAWAFKKKTGLDLTGGSKNG